LLTSTVTVPIYGKLSDLYGRKPVLLGGIMLFLIGSALSGLSQDMWQLVLFRGIQGLGAGSLFPIALAVIGDLFDLQKFPGKRGLQKRAFVNLEWALIADGVPIADVYKVLSTPEGVDRAFKKLDTIKSEVVWWEAGAQPPQLLADGQVVITSAWNGRIFNAVKTDGKPFKIVWDAQGFDWDWWAIPKGGPRVDKAYDFVAYSSQPDKMANQTKYISYGPANKDAIPNIDPAVLPDLPTAPQNMTNVLIVDPQFWADNTEQLDQRFNAWLAQ